MILKIIAGSVLDIKCMIDTIADKTDTIALD